jgi:murein DD-endopeptidase MepM/ murein hydrolase activator NlpD
VDFPKFFSRFPLNLQLRKSYIAAFGLALIVLISLGFYSQNQEAATPQKEVKLSAFPVTVPTIAWGFAIDTLQVEPTTIEEGQSLSDLLIAAGCTNDQMQQLITNASDVFDLRAMRAGKPLIKLAKDTTQAIDYLIYEPSRYSYIVFELKDDLSVWETKREVITKVVSAAGIIEGSLWNAMVDRGYSYELTAKMEDALQWSIDFHHLQVDDEFRLIYEEDFIEGEPVAVKNVIAAQYKTGDTYFHSIYFDNGDPEVTGYYSLEGKPMNAGFLKAPVKYARISSRYNLNRFHPVLKYRRPHYGTDYAAPYGTPIIAVGNGVVTTAGYTKGNGNYVKIRHNETHETQYLHMQKFAQGIRSGVPVKQGQVIGYVGSTGLATGPHVCFRFWQNGKQVNHLNLQLPPAKPLAEDLMPDFIKIRDQYVPQLEKAVPVAIERKEAVPVDASLQEATADTEEQESSEKNP